MFHLRAYRRTVLNRSSGVRLVDWDSGISGGGVTVAALEWRSFPERRRVSLAIDVGRQLVKGTLIVTFVIELNIDKIPNDSSIFVT